MLTGQAYLCAAPGGSFEYSDEKERAPQQEKAIKLFDAVRQKINEKLKEGKPDGTELMHLLHEMKSYAAEYDRIVFEKPGIYRYTSPVFHKIETDTRDWLGNEGQRMLEDFEEYFKALQQSLGCLD